MRRILVLLVATAFVAGALAGSASAAKYHYSSSTTRAYLNGCEQEASRSACQCTLRVFETVTNEHRVLVIAKALSYGTPREQALARKIIYKVARICA